MPWYEPNNRPPTSGSLDPSTDDAPNNNPHHRACDEVNYCARHHPDHDELDIFNYINDKWDYHPTRSENRGDRLQSRVEAHLANMFPGSAALFSNNGGAAGFDGFQFASSTAGHYYSNDHQQSVNLDREGDDEKPFRAAQFFHPRHVDLFSPITTGNGQENRHVDDDRKPSAVQVRAAPEVRLRQQHGLRQMSQGFSQHDGADNIQSFHLGSQSDTRTIQHGSRSDPSSFYNSQHSRKENFKPHSNSHNSSSLSHNQASNGYTGIQSSQQHDNAHSQLSQNIRNANSHGDSEMSQNSRDGDHSTSKLLQTMHMPHGTGEDQSPMPEHSPRDLFQVNNSAPPASSPFVNLYQKSKKTTPPAVQSTLTQNSKTGQLGISSYHQHAAVAGKEKTWDHYNGGGRSAVNAKRTADDHNKSKKQSIKSKDALQKKTSEKSRSKNNGQSEVENLLDTMHSSKTSKKRSSDPEKKSSDKSTKRSKQKTMNEVTNMEPAPTKASKLAENISIQDFAGLEHTTIQNAAQCHQGLQSFLTKVGKQKHVSWTMLFLDKYYAPKTVERSRKKKKNIPNSGKFDLPQQHQGFMISSAFLPTGKRYCTEKGPTCTAWNCTCDKQIRAKRSTAALLGAMFAFNDTSIDDEDFECYILPLGPTQEETTDLLHGYMSDWPTTPFECEVPMHERWNCLKAIVSSKSIKLVTYNATVSLLPLYSYLMHENSKRDNRSFNESVAYLSGKSVYDGDQCFQTLAADECLHSIWDLRLVLWLLQPHASEAQLEYSCIEEGFKHLIPDDLQNPNGDEFALLTSGLVEACNNLVLISEIFPVMNGMLEQNHLSHALEEIEAPVQSILAAMECRGIGLYPKRLQKAQTYIEGQIQQLQEKGRNITENCNFIMSSPKQVSEYLFDVLKLSMPSGLVQRTKEGSNHRSTSEETLKAIKEEMMASDGKVHPIIDVILEFRSFNKMLTSFVQPLPKFCYKVHESDDYPKIHPQWMQTSVRTGRFSCRKPNLQQVPKSMEHVDPRKAFVPSRGNKERVLFACDYSQKEVRILAHMCQDQALRSLFTDDKKNDIYKQMASLIRNKPVETVESEERAHFKQVTLAILYGMSPKQVAKNLSITEDAAKRTMSDFFRRFSTLKRWMDETKEFARKNKYVETIARRRRYLDLIDSDDRAEKAQAERQAINTVIQGSAADMMKSAMVNMAENIKKSWKGPAITRPQMLLQIHDELVLELNFDEDHMYWMKELAIKSCCTDCEKAFGLSVPLLLDCTVGLSWQAMKALGDAKG